MQPSRIIAAYSIVILMMLTLTARYFYLQIIKHDAFLEKSINNYSLIISTTPVRGSITDKHDTLLANSQVSHVIAILAKDIKNESSINQLGEYINITSLDKKRYELQLTKSKKYDWVIIRYDLSNQEIANFTSHHHLFPKFAIFSFIRRNYIFDELYAHSIGYVAKIDTLKNTLNHEYTLNDYIGKSGVEKSYEHVLRGILGRNIIQTNAKGVPLNQIKHNLPQDGHNLRLTIDHNLQKIAYEALGNKVGAIVAIDVQNGGILAFVSKPSFNPNWFIEGIDSDNWQTFISNKDQPMLNRALQGIYPPGSTIKPFMGLIALKLGIRDQYSKINDPGFFIIPGSSRRFHNSHNQALGMIDMQDAIRYSSDTYFYMLGYNMGIDKITKFLPMFYLGKKTEIDLPNEKSGISPSKTWKAQKFANTPNQKWIPADTVSIAVGQGLQAYTPLQLAVATSIIAANGTYIRPHILDSVLDNSGKIIATYRNEQHNLPFKPEDISFIKHAMQKAATSGTGYATFSNTGYPVAIKTGTAQVVGLHNTSHDKKFKDHAWIIGFAPVESAEIAIAIIVENSGWGAKSAAPILKKILDKYFSSNS